MPSSESEDSGKRTTSLTSKSLPTMSAKSSTSQVARSENSPSAQTPPPTPPRISRLRLEEELSERKPSNPSTPERSPVNRNRDGLVRVPSFTTDDFRTPDRSSMASVKIPSVKQQRMEAVNSSGGRRRAIFMNAMSSTPISVERSLKRLSSISTASSMHTPEQGTPKNREMPPRKRRSKVPRRIGDSPVGGSETTPIRRVKRDSNRSLRGDVSIMEVDDGEKMLHDAKDMLKETLDKKQETVPLEDGTVMHRSNVTLLMTVDEIPLTTTLSINARSNNPDSRIRLNEASFDGQVVFTSPEPPSQEESDDANEAKKKKSPR